MLILFIFRDDIIDEERKKRHDAEKLNSVLVDLYNNPDVTKELNNRLPRAKNTQLLSTTTCDDNAEDHSESMEKASKIRFIYSFKRKM